MDWGRSHLKCGILTGNEMHKLCQRYTNLFVFLRVYRTLPILGPSGQKLSDPKSVRSIRIRKQTAWRALVFIEQLKIVTIYEN